MKALLTMLAIAIAMPALTNSAAEPAPAPAPGVQAAADPTAIAKSLLDQLDAGRYAAAHASFSPDMAKAVDATQLQTIWKSLPQQFGAFQKRGAASVKQVDGMNVVDIPLAYAHGQLLARIAIDGKGKIAGFFIKPAPPPPAAVRADLPVREVIFAPPGRSTLPGTVLLPTGKGPFPAVVFVHGSGPNDRDETVGGTRVFRDLAEGLADRGIASLRYDKRTKVHPDEFKGAFTIDDETTDDAVAAVAFLHTQPDIDPQRIYVVGHSQGAMMAPRIAQEARAQVRGLVLMAAPARHLEDILVDQNEYMAHLQGAPDAKIQAQLDALKKAVAAVKAITAATPATQHFLLDLPASYWLSLQHYDDVAVARTLTQPLLILQGGRDFQVTAPDWKLWRDAFGHDPRASFHTYPALNHLFVAGKGPGSLAEYAAPAHVDPQVIADIARWIGAH